ncbi:MAG: hypothetical protein AAF611_13940 [Bacteroidota bacterium]
MKKQKVSLKKLQLSKSKVSDLTTNQVVGGSFVCYTNGCVITTGCQPTADCPVTTGCPITTNCLTDGCVTLGVGCTTNQTIACW